jgi:hypothetical protein
MRRYNDAAVVKKQRSIRLVVKKAEEHPAVVRHLVVRQTAVTPDSSSRPSVSNQQSASPQTASHQGPAVAAKCVSQTTSVASKPWLL